MTVVEADGYYVEPFIVENLYIYSGQTYSVIIKADQDPSRNYWATSNVISRHPQTPPGLAILNYQPNEPQRSPPTVPPAGPVWNDTANQFAQGQALKARQGFIHTPPPTSDRVLVFLTTQNTVNGYNRWAVNNVSLDVPNTPYLIALKYNMTDVLDQTPPPDRCKSVNYDIKNASRNKNATSSNAIYRLKFNSTVDIIMQNANTMKASTSETHPWHLHGHDFWILGYGLGKFDINTDPKKYNLVNPVMRNTVPVYPYGWTALRIKADNPGVWAFHCHIEPHFYLGMGVAFEAGIEKVGKLPKSIMGCGKSKGLFK
jgi:L-ascorbate oxidase